MPVILSQKRKNSILTLITTYKEYNYTLALLKIKGMAIPYKFNGVASGFHDTNRWLMNAYKLSFLVIVRLHCELKKMNDLRMKFILNAAGK